MSDPCLGRIMQALTGRVHILLSPLELVSFGVKRITRPSRCSGHSAAAWFTTWHQIYEISWGTVWHPKVSGREIRKSESIQGPCRGGLCNVKFLGDPRGQSWKLGRSRNEHKAMCILSWQDQREGQEEKEAYRRIPRRRKETPFVNWQFPLSLLLNSHPSMGRTQGLFLSQGGNTCSGVQAKGCTIPCTYFLLLLCSQ